MRKGRRMCRCCSVCCCSFVLSVVLCCNPLCRFSSGRLRDLFLYSIFQLLSGGSDSCEPRVKGRQAQASSSSFPSPSTRRRFSRRSGGHRSSSVFGQRNVKVVSFVIVFLLVSGRVELRASFPVG